MCVGHTLNHSNALRHSPVLNDDPQYFVTEQRQRYQSTLVRCEYMPIVLVLEC